MTARSRYAFMIILTLSLVALLATGAWALRTPEPAPSSSPAPAAAAHPMIDRELVAVKSSRSLVRPAAVKPPPKAKPKPILVKPAPVPQPTVKQTPLPSSGSGLSRAVHWVWTGPVYHPTSPWLEVVAKCIRGHESGVWNRDSGNGYFGAYQFSASTWRETSRLGGLASQFPLAVQTAVFERVWNGLHSYAERYGQWVTWRQCSYLG